jgi:hypothetical protein
VNDTYVHPWDQPTKEPDAEYPQICTTPQQTLRGLEIGLATQEVCCTGCRESMIEGETGWVYAYKRPDAPEWQIARCYCHACAPDRIETPTLGVSEVLVTTTFGVCSQALGQIHHLCLTDITLVSLSPPTEETPP